MNTRKKLLWVLMISVLGLSGSALGAKPTGTTITLDLTGIGTAQVLAWSWGASQSGTADNPGQANFQDVSLTKFVDALSPELLKRVATGQLIPSAILQSGAVTISIRPVLITSISLGGISDDESRQTENISLNFTEVVFASDGVEVCVNVVRGGEC